MARSTGSKGPAKGKATGAKRTIVRLAKVAVGLAAAWFAVEGGEYGTSDLMRQRRTERRLKQEIDSLQKLVDSLGRYEKRLQTDPALQEKIAREEFGMVRGNKEILYRFVEPAAGSADSTQPRRRP